MRAARVAEAMFTDTVNTTKSVVLAADVGSYSLATVNLAAAMAAALNTHLHGLFIEDEDLLQLSGLPFTREISMTTATIRPMGINQMERALRNIAQQFEQTLEREAESLKLTWSFDCIRGRYLDIGLKSDADVVFTILGQQQGYVNQPVTRPGPRRVLLVSSDSPYQQQALEALLKSFSNGQVEIMLVSDQPEKNGQALAQPGDKTERRINMVHLPRDRLDQLLEGTGNLFDCAIISHNEENASLLRMLKKLHCPVVLVGG